MPDSLSETVIDLYRRHATQWDSARRSSEWNDRVWIEAFTGRLARGSRVLDLGCGGGEPVARFLVERGLRVTGIDSSPQLIALARHRMPEQECAKNLRLESAKNILLLYASWVVGTNQGPRKNALPGGRWLD